MNLTFDLNIKNEKSKLYVDHEFESGKIAFALWHTRKMWVAGVSLVSFTMFLKFVGKIKIFSDNHTVNYQGDRGL